MTVNTEICNAFNAQAIHYDKAAVAQHEIGERLFERLDYLKINPRYVLDLGCGTGSFLRRFKQYYPNADVIGFDLAYSMLLMAKRKQRFRKKSWLVNGDMMTMPFASNAFDLVFANQVLHWASPVKLLMRELNRIMNVQGCLMFSTLGPDTFQEIRTAFASVSRHAHINEFQDMHHLGDALLKEHFLDPVMDMEMLTLQYKSLRDLINALKAQGVRNVNQARNSGLTGKEVWRRFERFYQQFLTPDGQLPLTYEVVYGHAWKGQQRNVHGQIETVVSVDSLLLK